MKIYGSPPVQSVQQVRGAGQEAQQAGQDSGDAASVSISSEANWIADLRADAASFNDVRLDVVDEVRSQLEAGTFEAGVDMDAAIDSLLGEL